MARKFTTPLDMQLLQILNALTQNLSSDPTANSGNAGLTWMNTTTNLLKWSNGTSVIDPLARVNHSGTQTSSTISDFTTAVQALRWASMTAPNAAVNMNSQQFSSLAAASSAGQAVEFAQFQTALANIASGMAIKETEATVVATANLSTTAPGATISGHTMLAGDSVLLTGQTTTSQNGLWSWNGAAVALTRRADASSTGSVLSGTCVVVGGQDGTSPHSFWMQTANGTGTEGAIVVGTDAQTWIMPFSASTFTGTAPISVTGSVISFAPPAGGGLTSAGNVDATVVTKKVSGSIPTGTTTITLTHNLNNACPRAVFRQSGAEIEVDNTATDANNLAVTFAVATAVATAYMVIG